jgi:hypothetical protein
MPDTFKEFISSRPVWAIIIIAFMGLPVVGAVAWVIIRALRKPDDRPE